MVGNSFDERNNFNLEKVISNDIIFSFTLDQRMYLSLCVSLAFNKKKHIQLKTMFLNSINNNFKLHSFN
jgi:hypothetical protein